MRKTLIKMWFSEISDLIRDSKRKTYQGTGNNIRNRQKEITDRFYCSTYTFGDVSRVCLSSVSYTIVCQAIKLSPNPSENTLHEALAYTRHISFIFNRS